MYIYGMAVNRNGYRLLYAKYLDMDTKINDLRIAKHCPSLHYNYVYIFQIQTDSALFVVFKSMVSIGIGYNGQPSSLFGGSRESTAVRTE